MDWKNHPLVVAATAVVATTALLLAVLFTAVIPTWVQHQQYKIADQEREIAEFRRQLGEFGTASDVLQAKSNRIIELEGEMAKCRVGWSPVFRAGSPYPADFGNITLGTPIAEVEHSYAFNKENIKIKKNLVEMTFPSPSGPFRKIAIYYDSGNAPPVVTSLLFFFSSDEAFKAAFSDAVKSFGIGTLIHQNGDDDDPDERWKWKNIGGVEVTMCRNKPYVYNVSLGRPAE